MHLSKKKLDGAIPQGADLQIERVYELKLIEQIEKNPFSNYLRSSSYLNESNGGQMENPYTIRSHIYGAKPHFMDDNDSQACKVCKHINDRAGG